MALERANTFATGSSVWALYPDDVRSAKAPREDNQRQVEAQLDVQSTDRSDLVQDLDALRWEVEELECRVRANRQRAEKVLEKSHRELRKYEAGDLGRRTCEMVPMGAN